MISLGKYAELEVIKELNFGFYLDGGPLGELLLPIRYAPENLRIGDDLRVFLYCDSDDRPIATTEIPFAQADEFAFLKVKSVSQHGAFLNWGLPKDLFVPFREQVTPMEAGKSYLVRVYVDTESDRLAASARLDRFLKKTADNLKDDDEVEIIVAVRTPMGFRVVVNGEFWGVIFESDIFQPLRIGMKLNAYVKQYRHDGKLDISLQRKGYRQRIPEAADILLDILKKTQTGCLALTDKSSPELIYKSVQMSKKSFKQAVGSLYKHRLVELKDDGIYLLKDKK